MTEQPNLTSLQYLRIFFRRREVFFSILFIMPLVVFNISNFLPKYYAASTLIKINDERILNPIIGDLAVASTVYEKLKSIEEEILTWGNLSAIISGLGIEKDVHSQVEYEKLIMDMRRSISVNMVSQDIIRITYRGKDPETVKEITDRISDLFIQKNVTTQNDSADHATEFISQQLKVYQLKLDESERVFTRFRLMNELQTAQERKNLLEGQIKLQPKEIVSQVEQRENPLVAKFKMHLIELEVELANLLVDATESHPRVKQIRADISQTKEQLAESIKNPQSIETRTINPAYQDLNRQIKDCDFQISKIRDELSKVEALNDKYESRALPEQELASLARDNRVNEHIYETLLARLETANITKRLEDSKGKTTFEVIDKARLPLKPVSPSLGKIILYSIFISFVVALAAIMCLEYMDTSFREIKEAQAVLEKPIIGSIATILTIQDLKVKRNRARLRHFLLAVLMIVLLSTSCYFYTY